MDLRALLGDLLDLGTDLSVEFEFGQDGVDLWVRAPEMVLAVEFKAVGDAAHVGSAIRILRGMKEAKAYKSKRYVPIVAVPFMGETGQSLCREADISWVDLSGNAWIDAPGQRIRILGRPNRFAASGRPANVFAPRSSRVVRALLMEPEKAFTQAELVAASGVDQGRVSRLVGRLSAMDLIVRSGDGRLRIHDPGLALEAWREAYQFERHSITRGLIGGRSAEELMRKLAGTLGRRSLAYAMTGLAGAWLLSRHAQFRTVTVLLDQPVEASLLRELRFEEESRGANVWLVVPREGGPLIGSRTRAGISCAHPVQVYLDLKAHAERAPEAAAELRKSLFASKGRG